MKLFSLFPFLFLLLLTLVSETAFSQKPGVDLYTSSSSFDVSYDAVKKQVSLDLYVYNRDTGSFSTNYTISYYISDDTVRNAQSVVLPTQSANGSDIQFDFFTFQTYAHYSVTFSVSSGNLPSGQLYLIVVLDSQLEVDESEETNNTSWHGPFQVKTGVDETAIAAAPLQAWPNPAASTLTVNFPTQQKGATQVRILDASGREALTCLRHSLLPGDNPLTLDISALAPGLYLLQSEGFGALRFIKE